MLYKILQDGIRRANVRGPLVMIFLLTYPRFKVIGFYISTPVPSKISYIYNTMLNFISVLFCTAYISVTFRARVMVSFRV